MALRLECPERAIELFVYRPRRAGPMAGAEQSWDRALDDSHSAVVHSERSDPRRNSYVSMGE